MNRIRSKLLLVGIIICVLVIAVLGIYIYNEWRIDADGESEYAILRGEVEKEQTPDAAVNDTPANNTVENSSDTLSEIEFENIPEADIPAGSNVVGWIESPGTIIDYPVMQGKDNEYYLNHLYNGKYSKVGSIFMDYRNDPGLSNKNTILYGHHMRSGKMFAELEKYKKQSYYEEHPLMYYHTEDGVYRIEVFAAVVVSGLDGIPVDFGGEAEYGAYVDGIRGGSSIKSNIEVNENDRIITLCACTYDFSNARITVIGKLVKVMKI